MSNIKFYEKSHKYKHKNKELTSVTNFISKFFPPFEGKELAKRLATYPHYKKKKMGMRKIMQEWKETAEHGTFVHKYLEKYCKGELTEGDWEGEIEEAEERSKLKIKNGIEWFDNWMRSRDEPFLYPEAIIYNLDLGLAGTIDLLVMENKGTDTIEQVATLIDWKTNTNFTKNYDKSNAYEPISHLPNTKLSKYALQLSLYAYMIELQGEFKIKELILVEIGEDKVKERKVEYLKEEIMEMIKHGKERSKTNNSTSTKHSKSNNTRA